MELNFSEDQLKDYLANDFTLNKPFSPKWRGRLNRTERSGGSFIRMDKQGAPQMDDEFATYMDENDSDISIPAERLADIINAMPRYPELSAYDARMNRSHAALLWHVEDRREGVTQEAFSQKIGVDISTAKRDLKRGVTWVADNLRQATRPRRPSLIPSKCYEVRSVTYQKAS